MISTQVVGGAVVIVLLLAIAIGVALRRQRRTRRPQWQVQASDRDHVSVYLTVVWVGDADASRVKVFGYRCDVDVVTEGPTGEHPLPMGFCLPVVRQGWKLHIAVKVDSALAEAQPHVVIEWWDWSKVDAGPKGRRPHQAHFQVHAVSAALG